RAGGPATRNAEGVRLPRLQVEVEIDAAPRIPKDGILDDLVAHTARDFDAVAVQLQVAAVERDDVLGPREVPADRVVGRIENENAERGVANVIDTTGVGADVIPLYVCMLARAGADYPDTVGPIAGDDVPRAEGGAADRAMLGAVDLNAVPR